MKMIVIILATYLFGGIIFETDGELWILDGKPVIVTRDAKGKPVKFTPIKGKKFDGTCPNCQPHKTMASVVERLPEPIH